MGDWQTEVSIVRKVNIYEGEGRGGAWGRGVVEGAFGVFRSTASSGKGFQEPREWEVGVTCRARVERAGGRRGAERRLS